MTETEPIGKVQKKIISPGYDILECKISEKNNENINSIQDCSELSVIKLLTAPKRSLFTKDGVELTIDDQ